MADVKRYEYPYTDLEPGKYRYGNGNGKPSHTVTVELNRGMHVNTRLVVTFTPGYYPSSIKDLPHGAYFEGIPADEPVVDFKELWIGDRFQALMSDGTPVYTQMWTKISDETARLHDQLEFSLGDRGYGKLGSSVCSFQPEEKVKFVPVVLP